MEGHAQDYRPESRGEGTHARILRVERARDLFGGCVYVVNWGELFSYFRASGIAGFEYPWFVPLFLNEGECLHFDTRTYEGDNTKRKFREDNLLLDQSEDVEFIKYILKFRRRSGTCPEKECSAGQDPF